MLLVEHDGRLPTVEREVQLVFATWGGLTDYDTANGAAVGAEQGDRTVLPSGVIRAGRALHRTQGCDALSGNEFRHVAPVRTDIAERRRDSGLARIGTPTSGLG